MATHTKPMSIQDKKVLIVDDEAPIRKMICLALEVAEFLPLEAESADDAWRVIHDARPDLILLDWMMPGVSGLEFARRLQRDENTRDLPIIMLTAKTEEDSKIQGLEAGADDYIAKPFSPRELVARIRAVLRRTTPPGVDQPVDINGLVLDPVSHRVSAHGEALQLGPTEYRLLQFFLTHPERAYSRVQLLDHVWGSNVYIEERTIDVHIRRLRKALEPSGHDQLIQTVRGMGYRCSIQ